MSAPVVHTPPTPPADPGGPAGPGALAAPLEPRRPGSRPLLWIGVTVGVLAIAQAAYQAIDWMSSDTTVSTEAYAAAPVLELTTDGDVTITVGDADGVTIEERTRTGFRHASHEAVESTDRLVVSHSCPQGWSSGICQIDLSVQVPRDTTVVVRTSSGGVRAEDIEGDLDLRSSDGDVTVRRAGGSVDAGSGSGRILVEGAGGPVVATSGDGDVTVREVEGQVSATSGSGRVTVVDAEGDVNVVSGDGAVEAQQVGGAVVATTSSGSVEVADVAGNIEATSGDGDVVVRGTGAPVALQISTGDGRSTVDAPTDPTASRTVLVRSSSGNVSYLGPR